MSNVRAVRNIIHSICDNHLSLDRGTTLKYDGADRADVALHFAVEIMVENTGYIHGDEYDVKREKSYFRIAHFIITAQHRAYVAVIGDLFGMPAAECFQNVCNHDTCWVSALDEIGRLARDGYDVCFTNNEAIPLDERNASDFCYNRHMSSISVQFERLRPIYRFVKVQRSPIDGEHLKDRLSAIKEMDFNVVPTLRKVAT